MVDLLKENGYTVDTTAVDALIESTVRELRIEQGQQKDSAGAKLIEKRLAEEAADIAVEEPANE